MPLRKYLADKEEAFKTGLAKQKSPSTAMINEMLTAVE